MDDISFDLEEGEILGFLGPNGSGKTTTIQMLLGTLTKTSGDIYYFGKDFTKYRSEILKQVSFASTYTSLPWILTLEENLIVFGYLYGLSRKESRRSFFPLLERFGILDKKDEEVTSLSAGQVTRLMLVKALFVNAKILLLDEPTASLDPDISRDICSFLLEQRDKRGISILSTISKTLFRPSAMISLMTKEETLLAKFAGVSSAIIFPCFRKIVRSHSSITSSIL